MKNILLKCASGLGLMSIWYIIHLSEPFLISNPFLVFRALMDISILGEAYSGTVSTFAKVGIAMLYASIVSLPVGIILGIHKKVYSSISYIIDFFRSIPATALFPIFLIIFGAGDQSKIMSAALAAGLVIIFNIAEGVSTINPHKIQTMKLFGASFLQILSKMVFFESLKYIFIGIRNGVSVAMIVIVATEMFIGTQVGLGKNIIDYQITYQLPKMYATVLLVGLMGYVLNKILQYVEYRTVHWKR